MLKLDSIYNFIENYIINKSIEPTLLKYKENNYINDYPEVDLKNIKITPHEKSLITVAKEVLI
jgi:p-aminobenzoyl-glutamate transporter AbgT